MNPDFESSPRSYTDRRTGLTVFGALTVLLGGLAALLVPLMVFGQALAPTASGPNPAIGPAAAMYGGGGLALIWLGVGSIFAHRWARALLLILAWNVLIFGIISIATLLMALPYLIEMEQPAGGPKLPEDTLQGILIFTVLFAGFILVFIPGLWALFYGSRHVKATCEARHPTPVWTDYCPLPVLAISLWLAAAVPMMLMAPLSYRAVLPFFGVFLTGGAGVAGYVAFAAIWGVAAWWIYRLDLRGWWLIFLASVILAVSNFLTYSRQDLSSMYELMGLPAAQIEQMRLLPFMSGAAMKWVSSAMMVPFVAAILIMAILL